MKTFEINNKFTYLKLKPENKINSYLKIYNKKVVKSY